MYAMYVTAGFPKKFLNNISKSFHTEKGLPTISQWILED